MLCTRLTARQRWGVRREDTERRHIHMTTEQATATTPLNTKGAAAFLGCTQNWIHKLVARRLLIAHNYNSQGTLELHDPDNPRQGQGLYFYPENLKQYTPQKRGHPYKKTKKT
jgi:hypothetical protein